MERNLYFAVLFGVCAIGTLLCAIICGVTNQDAASYAFMTMFFISSLFASYCWDHSGR